MAARIVIFVNGDFTAPESGSHIRFADQIACVARHFADVSVYSYREHDVAPWTEAAQQRFAAQFPGVTLILEPGGRPVRLAMRAKNLALMAMPHRARAIAAASRHGATPLLRALVRDPRTVFLVNFTDGLTELNGVPLERAIVDTIDIKFVRYAKLRGLSLFGAKALLRMRSELGLLSQVRGLIAISQAEAQAFRILLPTTETFYVPRYTAPDIAIDRDVPRTIDILFVGSLNRYNVEGLAGWLAENRAWLAPFKIAVAGKVCDAPELRALARDWPALALMGFVDELSGVYARAALVVSPVEGTGLNIKVMEALAHGKPVLASRHSLAALPPGAEACAFPITRDGVEAMLADPARRGAAEVAAAAYGRAMAQSGDLPALLGALQR
ncbi:glycosyltransferase family 4 protein [Sphingomonas profundi]|uniref:glycosyltransferase family 4 protein n=1 Tax=Alterirhizorhabdus profundi TaxID=2681549 RepID=UPI0012E809F9|nr:glycosyltransferase family 4 protein [Sphingomonas profundi]